MQRKQILITASIIFILFLVALLFPFFGLFNVHSPKKAITEVAVIHKLENENKVLEKFKFNLSDPEQAPPSIREAVLHGYQIMLDTPKYASQYAGDRLSCTNCHFAGGDTTGGKNGGISLAGVNGSYPKLDEGVMLDLAGRVNKCFERSMNGKAVPVDSPEMKGILAYLKWISKGVPKGERAPWLGLPNLKSKHIGNAESGKNVYDQQCALCHGIDGLGDVDSRIPPLWGEQAYNDAAGMNKESTMASFVYYNMPYEELGLTEEQALDVAAFVVRQPRPHFNKKSGK
jgi:thiosulfate dehydrogenase